MNMNSNFVNYLQTGMPFQYDQKPRCECHECTQARWRDSIQGKMQGLIPPPKVENKESKLCPHCGKDSTSTL